MTVSGVLLFLLALLSVSSAITPIKSVWSDQGKPLGVCDSIDKGSMVAVVYRSTRRCSPFRIRQLLLMCRPEKRPTQYCVSDRLRAKPQLVGNVDVDQAFLVSSPGRLFNSVAAAGVHDVIFVVRHRAMWRVRMVCCRLATVQRKKF